MELHFHTDRNRYELVCTFEQRDAVKKAGLKWCGQANVWFAQDWYFAWKACEKLNISLPEQLQKYQGRYQKSFSESSEVFEYINDEAHFAVQHLQNFQRAGLEELIFRKRFVLLADEQGLGKTIQALEFAKFCIHVANKNGLPRRKTLVICPASLKINWAREAKKFDQNNSLKVKILRGKTDKVEDQEINLVVVNYDLLSSGIIFSGLEAYQPDLILADEAHLLKSADSARTKHTFNLAKIAKKFIAISGTPIPNRPIEIFPLLKKFSPETLGAFSDQRKFEYHFCNGFQDRWGFNNSGASNLEELGERLRATCMVRRLKTEVLGDNKFPPQILAFEADKTTRKLAMKEKELAAEFLKKNKEIPSIGEIAEIRQELALRKLPLAVEFIKDLLLTTQKVVVFAHHREIIKQLGAHFKKSVTIAGGMSEKAKQQSVDLFQNDPEVEVFIGQIQAAGVGITLTAANQVVFVESAWSPGEIDQCVDRCDRIGQTKWVQARFLVIEDSLEEHMLKVAFDKAKNINKIMR